jgi:hypothetical protein
MRSAKLLIPGESAELYQARLDGFMESFNPRNDAERALVERFAALDWKALRGEAIETARVTRLCNEVQEGAALREAEEVMRLAAQIEENRTAVLNLHMIPSCLRFLISEWSILRDRLQSATFLLGLQRQRLLFLLGKCREDVLRDDKVATRYMKAMLGALFQDDIHLDDVAAELGSIPLEGMHEAEFLLRAQQLGESLPGPAEAHALLLGYIEEEIERLEAELLVVEPRAQRDRALDVQAAGMELTPDGVRLSQYIHTSYRGIDAALRRLDALQNPRR